MRTVVLVITLTFGIVACQLNEPGSDDRTQASGVYGLQSLNGQALPYKLASNDTDAIEILSDTIRLTADGNYMGVERYRRSTSTSLNPTPVVTLPVDTVRGTWGILGATISLTATTGDISSAFFRDNTLTVSDGSLTAIYNK